MATVNFIPRKKQCVSSMKHEIEYILQDSKVCIAPEKLHQNHTENYKTYSPHVDKSNAIRLISGKDCCVETAFMEFMATKKSFKKANQTMFYHYDQSFKDGEPISPKTAHEIALKLPSNLPRTITPILRLSLPLISTTNTSIPILSSTRLALKQEKSFMKHPKPY